MTAPLPDFTRKESLWLTCRQKSCCHAVVVPTGRDIWRIVRTLGVPPSSFLVCFETTVARRDAFALDGSARRFRLALARRPGRRTKSPPPCTFLLRTRDGHHRCGLGALRPTVCRAFPAEQVDGVLCVQRETGCACRRWTLADVDIDEEAALVTARQADAAEYCTIVARWNMSVPLGEADPATVLATYCEYLLGTYDAMAAGAAPSEGTP